MTTPIKSSFNGIIQELPGILIDNFENPGQKKARAFFLSHCHSDHIQGLHSLEFLNFVKASNVYIFTTSLNSAILDYEKKEEEIMQYVRVLDKGSTLITLPSLHDLKEEYITVTLIPAGHCIGSTMFLFKTTSKTILFTGDFRININDVSKYKALHKNNETIKIDTVYIDTTFLHIDYEDFPKRSDSIEQLIYEINKWLSDSRNAVALHTSARYGYEHVFNEINRLLGTKVFVGDNWNFYRTITHLVSGVTNNEEDTRIHLCRRRNETSHSKCIKKQYQRYLYVNLSAMKWTMFKSGFTSINWLSTSRLDVCFPTHCSRSELLYFINYLSPTKIIGFPNAWKTDNRPVNVMEPHSNFSVGDSSKRPRLQ